MGLFTPLAHHNHHDDDGDYEDDCGHARSRGHHGGRSFSSTRGMSLLCQGSHQLDKSFCLLIQMQIQLQIQIQIQIQIQNTIVLFFPFGRETLTNHSVFSVWDHLSGETQKPIHLVCAHLFVAIYIQEYFVTFSTDIFNLHMF